MNIHIAGVLEEREKLAESLFKETVVENFPNLRKDVDIQVQEA